MQDLAYPRSGTPDITPSHTPHGPAPAELVARMDRYALLWMLRDYKH